MTLAAVLFVQARSIRPWSMRFPWAQRLLERKYYFDEIYNAVFVRPMDALADIGLRDVEEPVIDGALIATGQAAVAGASGLSLTQSGYFRNYVLVFVGGAEGIALSKRLGNLRAEMPFAAAVDRQGRVVAVQLGKFKPDTPDALAAAALR